MDPCDATGAIYQAVGLTWVAEAVVAIIVLREGVRTRRAIPDLVKNIVRRELASGEWDKDVLAFGERLAERGLGRVLFRLGRIAVEKPPVVEDRQATAARAVVVARNGGPP
jgi:hypothetical protein